MLRIKENYARLIFLVLCVLPGSRCKAIPGCSGGVVERFIPWLEATRIEAAIDWVTTAITLLYVNFYLFCSFSLFR